VNGSGCEVTGFAELDAKLDGLSHIPLSEIAEALMAGAKILGDEERRLVPRRTGNLARSLVEDMQPSNLPVDGYTVYVGPRIGKGGPDGWYGYLVEMGHEGVPAHPFARPTVDMKGEAAVGVVMSRLAASVMRIAA
jgi:HK97 gp10 family phage protein